MTKKSLACPAIWSILSDIKRETGSGLTSANLGYSVALNTLPLRHEFPADGKSASPEGILP